ncbi:MAG: hypothetical protein M3Y59_14035 [Myxococcota bacterium]|nr:hypothetical protein [Myxococcota bacterium]
MRPWILIAALVVPLSLSAQDSYQPLGEVQLGTSSASFDEDSVRGPRVQVTREEGGHWTGRIGDMVVDGIERPNGVRGANFALYVERVSDGTIVRGNLLTRTVFIKIPHDEQQRYYLRYTLKGVADTTHPPAAQFALAVAGASIR